MTMTRRSLAALASPSRVAVALTWCALALAANAVTTRVHRIAAPSEKPAPVLQQSAPTRDRQRGREQSKHAATPKAKDRATVKPGVTHRGKMKPREPVPVDDPILVHRASRVSAKQLHASGTVIAQQAAKPNSPKPGEVGKRSARDRRNAHAPSVAPAVATVADADPGSDTKRKPVETNKLSVNDFVRAAGDATEEAAQSVPPVNASVAPASGPPAPVATQLRPAPIVRRVPAAVSAQMKSAEVGPLPAPQVETVEGFGAEVDLLPLRAATKAAGASKNLPVIDKTTTTDKGPAPILEARAKLTDDAMMPLAAPLYSRSGRLVVPLPLKGTREILMHQNQMADDAGLTRIQDDDDLNRMRAQHLLSSFPEMAGLEVNEELPVNRRYARPWTVRFVTDLAKAYFAQFHEPLRLNSAVRTVEYQLRLQRVNGNAAAVEGETASPHLTGQAIDFGKHGMSVAEIAWMRSALLPLMQSGKIDVEEEFQQACFHISVYAAYAPKKRVAPKTELAQLHRD